MNDNTLSKIDNSTLFEVYNGYLLKKGITFSFKSFLSLTIKTQDLSLELPG